MTGFIGGQLTDTLLSDGTAELYREDWYEHDQYQRAGFGLSVLHHGEKDPNGSLMWRDKWRMGAVYGSITNRDDINEEQLFNRLLDDPQPVLRELDGSFLIVAIDSEAERVVLASDKLGTRQAFYIKDDPFAFSSEVGALTALLNDPQVNERAISDLVMIGHVWGDKTLVEGINFLPSGTVLEYERGSGYELNTYWDHTFSQSPDDSYLDELTGAYQSSIADMAATMDGSVGMWLSGGLDSRAMAAELSHYHNITAYTYDSNPSNGSNIELAARVSEELGIENERVMVDSDKFVDSVDTCVQLTSGMVGMSTFFNLATVFNIEQKPDLLIEGCGQGGMMGDGINRSVIKDSNSPEEALYRAKHRVDVNTARKLLDTSFDPMTTYREEVQKSKQTDFYGITMDCYYRNYFPRCDFASNPIAESQAGTRVPFANTKFLSAVTKMPLDHRVGTIPLTNGKIPTGTAFPKLELMRRLDKQLSEIPYERTKIPPSRPLWQHAAGFVVGTSLDRLRQRFIGDINTYGGRSTSGEWYEENEAFRKLVDNLLDSACQRPYFNEECIRQLQWEQLSGEASRMGAISGIITGELWVQKYIDQKKTTTKEALATTNSVA